MKLRPWIIFVALLAAADGGLSWRDAAQRHQSGNANLVDTALLDPALLEKTRRIVVREKPQEKVVSHEEGFEVRVIPDKDAPIRETILARQGNEPWVVTNCFGLDADPAWLGQTMRDLSQGRLVRYVTGDPALMDDLSLDLAQVRLEDESGRVIRRLDFGRKDGSPAHQFVRIDGGDVFVAKHDTEIVGDPLGWTITRVLRFDLGQVREAELPFTDAGQEPLLLRRAAPGTPLLPVDPALPAAPTIARNAEKILGKLLLESLMLALAPSSPAAATAHAHLVARVHLTLFDGHDYTIGYGVLPKGDPASAEIKDYDASSVAFAFYACSDPQDLAARSSAKAALGYNRASTVGRLPRNRAALAVESAPEK